MMQQETSPWQALLIGGSSGVGKSVTSQELAQTLHVSHVLVDDIRIAIQAVTSPSDLPVFHYFLTKTDLSALPAEEFIEGLIGIGRALTPALCDIISHHIAVPEVGRLLLEGDGILPEIVEILNLFNHTSAVLENKTRNIQIVFLYEADEAHLLQNFIDRDRGFNQGATADQQKYVHTIWRYGLWLKAEAERYHIPVLAARPYATLAQRILAAIS